jgi:hypothetical protein
VTATLHRVRLYRKTGIGRAVREVEAFLDPTDNAALHEVLIQQARIHAGERVKLDQWRIKVEQTKRPVHVVADVTVDAAGRLQVKR